MHAIVVDDEPGEDGWGYTCVLHGREAGADSRTAAFLAALEHDAENGGDTAR